MLKKPLAKVIITGVILLLLLAAIIPMTVAWYTKMVSVSDLKFEAAKWDFTANFAIDDIKVNVYEYSTLTKEKAAPGTEGFIPLKLSAFQSDTDIEYRVTISKDTMSEEFQQRIFFYYLADPTKPRSDISNRVYFVEEDKENGIDATVMKGIIKRPDQKTDGTIIPTDGTGSVEVMIYWEWIYEAPETINGVAATEEQRIAWDEFDTEVGKDPERYAKEMTAKITIVGVQVEPAEVTEAN